jgi:hypothetical protein
MPIIFKDLTVDEANSVGDSVIKNDSGGGKKGGSNNQLDTGGKTFNSIRKEEVSNSQNRRRKESEDKIIKSLEHFPKEDHKEVNEKNIDKYCSWLIKSIEIGEPVIETKDLHYGQYSAKGPGGQNVNKVANAVLYKHLITGLFANSKDSRNTLENRDHASSSLYEDLKIVVDDWKVVLSDIPSKNWDSAIKTFIKNSLEIK